VGPEINDNDFFFLFALKVVLHNLKEEKMKEKDKKISTIIYQLRDYNKIYKYNNFNMLNFLFNGKQFLMKHN